MSDTINVLSAEHVIKLAFDNSAQANLCAQRAAEECDALPGSGRPAGEYVQALASASVAYSVAAQASSHLASVLHLMGRIRSHRS